MALNQRWHEALALAEILERILNLLEAETLDSASLLYASLVSRKWFDCAIRVLWRKPPCSALAAIDAPDRRQLYASNINSLVFNGNDGSYHSLFKHVNFPNLKRVSLDSYHPPDGATLHLHQYLQPRLEEFVFFGGRLEQDVLDTMASQCPRLRTLLIDNAETQVSPSFFIDFITRCRSLEDLVLAYGMDELLSDDLFVHLAARDSLKSLDFGRPITAGVLERINAQGPTPFKATKRLHGTTVSAAVPLLVNLVGSLTMLRLDVKDGQSTAIRHLSSLTNLRFLSIQLPPTSEPLLRVDLLSLTSLSKLESLAIMDSLNDIGLRAPDFTGADFEQLVSHLKHLRCLAFRVQCNITATGLQSLSKHCRSLETCELLPSVNLQILEQGPEQREIAFPQLKELEIGGFSNPQNCNNVVDGTIAMNQARRDTFSRKVIEAQRLLRKHFPKLEDLCITTNDAFSTAVTKALDQDAAQH